ncbi:carboxypeptidase-like regulatory domain-containing protein [Olleya sp. YS]|uniref:carboxypeptidase-like regulatory domain-containing protein n=1 Tax=Olleya sp. YS TaxID=3028318 RepID=UPI002434442E|nr:carboxypeptidase-like regulatory domain-containing protein [Olleya sp. YS]WGD34757.1 carboxypeptidase-like regulatory domain-containing protein [Olleya sp. YS]
MRTEIRVTIPEPCHEDWNTMTPKDRGRYCKVCEKTVVDFTNKTDEYIVKTYEKEGKLCGRFKQQQLDRPLAYSRKDSTNYLAVASTAVLAYLSFGNTNAYAQQEPKTDTTSVNTTNHIKGKIAQSILKTKIISGRVIGNNNKPLPNVLISEKGTNNFTKTNVEGHYTIKVSNTSVLVFSHESYQNFEILVENNNYISIEMVEKTEIKDSDNTITISGVITDENNLPLPTANIVIKGTNKGTSTDFDGNYSLEVNKNDVLTASYIGYESKDYVIKDNTLVNIKLDPDYYYDEVIVGGAFTVNRHYRKTKEERLEIRRLKKINKEKNREKRQKAKAERKCKRLERRANKS